VTQDDVLFGYRLRVREMAGRTSVSETRRPPRVQFQPEQMGQYSAGTTRVRRGRRRDVVASLFISEPDRIGSTAPRGVEVRHSCGGTFAVSSTPGAAPAREQHAPGAPAMRRLPPAANRVSIAGPTVIKSQHRPAGAGRSEGSSSCIRPTKATVHAETILAS
jgi:hypothetical protein